MSKIIVSTLFFFLCYSSIAMAASTGMTVFVSVIPQKYFIEQISGDLFAVQVMVEPGASPATYEPKPSQMRKLSASKCYFAIGVPFEKAWLDKLQEAYPQLQIIHTDKGINKRQMSAHAHDQDDHGNDHHDEQQSTAAALQQKHDDEHHESAAGDTQMHHSQVAEQEEHRGLDPHIWLSPRLVMQQIATIRQALVALAPDHAQQIKAGAEAFQQQVENLSRNLEKLLAPYQGRKFMVFHPSWGYFADEFGLQQVAAEVEGKEPKPRQLKELIELARHEKIHTVFAQPQFSQKSARVIAQEIAGQVLLIDPLAYEWQENLEQAAQQIHLSLMEK